MTVETIDHVNIRTADVAATCQFFATLLDMEIRNSPGMADRTMGAWICDREGRAVIHVGSTAILYPGEEVAVLSPEGSGRIHHVALRCRGFDAMVQKLDGLAMPYRTNRVEEVGLRQIFLTETNGILLELNFFGD